MSLGTQGGPALQKHHTKHKVDTTCNSDTQRLQICLSTFMYIYRYKYMHMLHVYCTHIYMYMLHVYCTHMYIYIYSH